MPRTGTSAGEADLAMVTLLAAGSRNMSEGAGISPCGNGCVSAVITPGVGAGGI